MPVDAPCQLWTWLAKGHSNTDFLRWHTVDTLTPERRSWLMARVKMSDTSPELRVRKCAHAVGLRFRLQRRDLPGRPDLVFPKRKIVLFVHGCFWHRHAGCRKTTTPKTRAEFWQGKFDRNVERDRETAAELTRLGWKVVTVWECETVDREALSGLLERTCLRCDP
jgi:DNA mismatch endonuclease, patch repair protein